MAVLPAPHGIVATVPPGTDATASLYFHRLPGGWLPVLFLLGNLASPSTTLEPGRSHRSTDAGRDVRFGDADARIRSRRGRPPPSAPNAAAACVFLPSSSHEGSRHIARASAAWRGAGAGKDWRARRRRSRWGGPSGQGCSPVKFVVDSDTRRHEGARQGHHHQPPYDAHQIATLPSCLLNPLALQERE